MPNKVFIATSLDGFIAQTNLIDEIAITTVPVLLGNGIALFGNVDSMKLFKCCQTRLFNNGYVMNQYIKS